MKPATLSKLTRRLPIPRRHLIRLVNRIDVSPLKQPALVNSRRPLPTFMIEINDVNEEIQKSIFFFGYYEARESLYFSRNLRAGDLFVDVGANLGWFSLLAASAVAAQGRVVAFEPSSIMYDRLIRNIEINAYSNVETNRCALGDITDRIDLHGGTTSNLGKFTMAPGFRLISDIPPETVEVMRFDDWWDKDGRPTVRLLKIDVEGLELQVLEGAAEALSMGAVKEIIVEVKESRSVDIGYESAELLAFLRQFGAEFFRLGWSTPRELQGRVELEGNILVRFPNVDLA